MTILFGCLFLLPRLGDGRLAIVPVVSSFLVTGRTSYLIFLSVRWRSPYDVSPEVWPGNICSNSLSRLWSCEILFVIYFPRVGRHFRALLGPRSVLLGEGGKPVVGEHGGDEERLRACGYL